LKLRKLVFIQIERTLGTVDLELYEVRNETFTNTIYISLKQQTVMSWLYFTRHTDVIIKQDKVI
jgi:hypothetical protein